MSDIDRVFARQGAAGASTSPRRQLATVPRHGTRGGRVVEVVHLKPRASSDEKAQPRHAARIGSAAWREEISGKGLPPAPAPALPPSLAPSPRQPVVHVLPAWEPRQPVAEEISDIPPQRRARSVTRQPRVAPQPRRVADPFDTSDDGANCIRCGYAVEQAREKRGLMTCAGCG